MGNCDVEIDREVNCVIDQILQEDRLESMGLDPCPDSCEALCEEIAGESSKNCAIETSARFSMRILEALRAIQRQKATCSWPSSKMEEIVQYIRCNYNYDGDLCSQVETALDQVTAQGFVLRMGSNRYHLMGPFACSIAKPLAHGGCNRNSRHCGRPKSSRGRRGRRPCTPNANSTFAASHCPGSCSLDRLSTVSDVEVPQFVEIQNRGNRERSLIREDDGINPLNDGQDISIFEQIHAPIPRVGEIHMRGGGREDRDHEFDENLPDENPPLPYQGIRRPGGGGGRGMVIRDRIADEDVEELHRPVPNAQMERIGACADRGEMFIDDHSDSDENIEEIENPVPPNGAIGRRDDNGGCGPVIREHSSDENMYRVEPANNNPDRRRRRRRRDNSSSESSSDGVISRCPARRSRMENSNSSSDADVSDDADVDEPQSAKPWIRNCQKQNSRISSRRGKRRSSCIYD